MLKFAVASIATAIALAAPSLAAADYYSGLKAFDSRQYAAAAREWEAAARAGDAKSAFRLGKLYQNGRGVARNYGQAYYWFKVAEARGNVDAGIAAHFAGQKIGAAQRAQIAARAKAFRPGASVASNPGNQGNRGNPGNQGDGARNGGTDGGTDGGAGDGAAAGGPPFGPMPGKELRHAFQDGEFHRSEIWRFDRGGRLTGVAYMTAGGTLSRTEQDADSGRWTIEGGRLCVTWLKWNAGRKVCYTATKVGRRWRISGTNGTSSVAQISTQ